MESLRRTPESIARRSGALACAVLAVAALASSCSEPLPQLVPGTQLTGIGLTSKWSTTDVGLVAYPFGRDSFETTTWRLVVDARTADAIRIKQTFLDSTSRAVSLEYRFWVLLNQIAWFQTVDELPERR